MSIRHLLAGFLLGFLAAYLLSQRPQPSPDPLPGRQRFKVRPANISKLETDEFPKVVGE